MLETARLTLKPLTASEVRLHVAGQNRLERTLNLPNGQREVTEPLRSILTNFTIPRLESGRVDPLYHTIWVGIDCASRRIVADIKLKGEPDESGSVEIGYGTYPTFQRQGYMTEIVGGLLAWAAQQPGIRRVEAETAVENVASQKVLEANGFTLFDRREDMLWWEWWPLRNLNPG
jgi:[ribosomal protein S5]-alanine N-acetyltransferase